MTNWEGPPASRPPEPSTSDPALAGASSSQSRPDERRERLFEVLEAAQQAGLLGASSIDDQVSHAHAFRRALVAEPVGGPVLDLGAGGGLPGLVLAVEDPLLEVVLLDSTRRSTDFLGWAVDQLQLGERVAVLTMRAEEAGREPRHRGRYEAVVARSFARPGVTAECGAPFLAVGGRLLVSEPPPSERERDAPALPSVDRWPPDRCAELGLVPEGLVVAPFRIAVLRQVRSCPERYPRRTGIPNKRPLF